MKRDMKEIDLQNAFWPMTNECHDRLTTALSGLREEQPVKRFTARTVLIAACIIVALMAVAYAAGQIFGWNDFYSIFYGTKVPKAAVEILESTEKQNFVVGPAAFTVQQLYADSHTAMASVKISMTDGSRALMTMSGSQYDSIDAGGENGEKYAESLGLDPSTNWISAAEELNCPLYIMRGILDLDSDYWGGEAMEDVLYNDDGSMTYYSMQMLDSKKVGDELPLKFFLRVAEVDPQTGEEKEEVLIERPELNIRVSKPTDTVTYSLPEPYTVSGLTLDAVYGELTPAGLYLFTDFTAGEEADMDAFGCPQWFDADGNEYPWGLNLSYDINVDNWPKVSMMGLISVDSIPEKLIMSMKDETGIHNLSLPDGSITILPLEEEEE